MKKLIDTVSLIADLLPGAALVALGVFVAIGGMTGALWL